MDLDSGFAGPYLSHSYLQILFSLEKKKKVKRRNSGSRAVLVSLLDLQIISRDSRERLGKSELAGSNSVLTVVRSSGITTALIEHSLEYVSLQSFLSHSVERRGKRGDRHHWT